MLGLKLIHVSKRATDVIALLAAEIEFILAYLNFWEKSGW